MMGHISDLCSPSNTQRFTCNGAKVVYNASMIWGTIGPQRMFQAGQVYNALMYFFIIGPVVTVLVWLVYRRHPNSWIKWVNVPIFFNAAGNIPPANTTQYSLWFIFGFLFNYLIRKKAFQWWTRYNCQYPALTFLVWIKLTSSRPLASSHGYRHSPRNNYHLFCLEL